MSTSPADENVESLETETAQAPEASYEVPPEALMGGAEPVPTVQIS